ncbi:MAG: hypothetical protein IT429_09740 [Gemmataceae bacterium]|nr:hypothetical protein [Gemmataceae bacterium]
MSVPVMVALGSALALVGGGLIWWCRRARRHPLRGPHQAERFGHAPEKLPGRCFSGLTKGQAEQLLDRLESEGRTDCELTYEPEKGFTVWVP